MERAATKEAFGVDGDLRRKKGEEEMNYCPRCGAPEQSGARFCPSCGRRYDSASGPSFSWKDALNWRPLEAATERVSRWLEPVNDAIERWIRLGVDALLAENFAAPSYIVWNILALLFCSVPCGLIGVVYSLRVLQLRKNHDASPVPASKSAKIWLALAVVYFLLIRVPFFLKMS